MGVRADFYIGRGKNAKWLGSIAWAGCPRKENYPAGIDESLFKPRPEAEWQDLVEDLLRGRKDATLPHMGWPWPWEDSHTSDYAYAIENGTVYATHFGEYWYDPLSGKRDATAVTFPDMSAIQKVTHDPDRSGVICVCEDPAGGRLAVMPYIELPELDVVKAQLRNMGVRIVQR